MTLFNDVVKLSLVEREVPPTDETGATDANVNRNNATSSKTAPPEGGGAGRLYHKLRWKRPIHVGRTIGPLYAHAAVIAKSHMYIIGKWIDELIYRYSAL